MPGHARAVEWECHDGVSRNANVVSQLFVCHAVGAANEAGNQILLFLDTAPGHDPFQRRVIAVIKLRDNLA